MRMTDSELSLKIAESLEPRPKIQHPDDYWYDIKSPLGFWRAQYFEGSGWRVIPNDFVNDPAMTMMLIKTPGFLSLKARLSGDIQEYQATFLKPVTSKPFICECDWEDDLGRAVAEAYAMAKNLI